MTNSATDYFLLRKVNRAVNRSERLDRSPILASGKCLVDCEWFSFFKREELRKLQIDSHFLDVETETSNTGEPNHRVLIVGKWVLDNRKPNPYKSSTFKRLGYKPFPGHPGTSK